MDSYIHVAHTEIHLLVYQHPVLQLQVTSEEDLGITVNDLVTYLGEFTSFLKRG